MLVRVGWKPDFVEKCVPVLPISGWMGDNLIKKSEKMTWWVGGVVGAGAAWSSGAAAGVTAAAGALWLAVQQGRRVLRQRRRQGL